MKETVFNRLRLSELIPKFSVSFRLRPAYGSVYGTGEEIGCEVELIGQHYFMGNHVGPGCPHCVEVLLVLLELHDRMLSGQHKAYAVEDISAQCEKFISYASTAGDWPEVVLDVKIIRRPTLHQVSENWLLKLTDEIRAELLDLGCREIPSVYMPAGPLTSSRLRVVERVV